MRVLDAVSAGMGLLLRATAPLADGDTLGIRVRNAQLPASFSLPTADAGSASHIRLTRTRLQIDNHGGTSVLREAMHAPVAGERDVSVCPRQIRSNETPSPSATIWL